MPYADITKEQYETFKEDKIAMRKYCEDTQRIYIEGCGLNKCWVEEENGEYKMKFTTWGCN